jgi:eukaryotic-like serine/threonine-protein kinase
MIVSNELIEAAYGALGVEYIRDLRDGGQKVVKVVRQGEHELVIKVVSVASSSPGALSRARREVELLQTIDDVHVVRAASDLVELGDPVEGAAWLEELLDGEDLRDLLTSPWSWAETADMARDVALGLWQMHAVGVVHRDLSASNVRRRGTGTYVVMDPGFARHTLRTGLTIGGQPGTLGFFTPEHLQAYSGSPTPASDVFGVGILMFLALTTQFPIPHLGDDADYLRRVGEGLTLDLATIRPDLSEPQVAVVKRALHPQSARRHRNGKKLAAALEALT